MLAVSDPRDYNGNQDFCVEGCAATAMGGVQCHWLNDTATGDFVAIGAYCAGTGPFRLNGRNCASYGNGISDIETVETENPPNWWETGEDANDCTAGGGAYGEVNGVMTCVAGNVGGSGSGEGTGTGNGMTPGGSETKPPSTETTTNPDGTSSTKEVSTATNCTGGQCTTTETTTTTTRDAQGNQTGSETTTKETTTPASDFCAKNPTAPSCVGTEGKESKWTGSCSSGTICTGDAVQCAIAKAAHEERCSRAWAEQPNEMADLAAAAMNEANNYDGQLAARALNKNGEFDFNIVDAFNDAQDEYVTFTKECISVPAINVMGVTLEFDVGVLCDVGSVLRLFLHLLAYMAAIKIIISKV